MKWKWWEQEPEPSIDEQITAVLNEMTKVGVDSPEYKTYMKYLERLNGMKAKNRKSPVSSDMVVQVCGYLAGVLIIVIYEEKHVITSKAFGDLPRPKLLIRSP